MRILGSTILDTRLGKKYQITQAIIGNSSNIDISSTITQPENIYRVKQIIKYGSCELIIKE